MKIHSKNNNGFTLIELLVVISIISFLSSVVFSAVGGARVKAKDAAIMSAMKQLGILFNLEYSEAKNYTNLQQTNSTGWINLSAGCSGAFTTGNYAAKAVQICQNILSNITASGSLFYSDTSGDLDQKYSAMAQLSTGKYFCVGSSGSSALDTGTWSNTGCWANP